jgi:hypothetical protein
MAGHTGRREKRQLRGVVFAANDERIRSRRRTNMSMLFIFVSQTIPPAPWPARSAARWVEAAREHDAILLFDAAYEAYF